MSAQLTAACRASLSSNDISFCPLVLIICSSPGVIFFRLRWLPRLILHFNIPNCGSNSLHNYVQIPTGEKLRTWLATPLSALLFPPSLHWTVQSLSGVDRGSFPICPSSLLSRSVMQLSNSWALVSQHRCFVLFRTGSSVAARRGWLTGRRRAFSYDMAIRRLLCVLYEHTPDSLLRASNGLEPVCPVIFLSAEFFTTSSSLNCVFESHFWERFRLVPWSSIVHYTLRCSDRMILFIPSFFQPSSWLIGPQGHWLKSRRLFDMFCSSVFQSIDKAHLRLSSIDAILFTDLTITVIYVCKKCSGGVIR